MRNKTSKAVLLTVLGLLIVAGSVVVGIEIGKNKVPPQPSPTPIVHTPIALPTPTPTPQATADVKTYTNTTYGLSFQYPQTYKVEERVPGFIVISASDEHTPQGGISIDARQQGSYQTYEKAREYIQTTFTVSSSKEINGWMTYDAVGKEDMLKGMKFKLAIAKYKTGAIEMETIDNEPYRSIFDQILSTFKFTK